MSTSPRRWRELGAALRGRDTGLVPVLAGLVLISVVFQVLNSHFLSAGNLVNLVVQGAVFMMLAMSEIFVLLLGEIDLSSGFVAGVAGVVAAELVKDGRNWPFALAVLVALAVSALIGALQGTIIARLGLPSFIVTLGGLLAWQGVMLFVLGTGEGLVPVTDHLYVDVANGFLSRAGGWVAAALVVGLAGVLTWRRDARRRRSGLVAPSVGRTATKIGFVAIAAAVAVVVSNIDRGSRLAALSGVPWVLLIVLAVLFAWSWLVDRTRFGRYLRAIGGNTEAARRAGIEIARIRTLAFVMSSMTAGMAGIVYASRLRSVSSNLDGGGIVLYSVAAAVIGGTSLFGGRGRMRDGVLGGIVIAAINNGMSLQGYGTAARLVVTALVLVLAVTLDALARRRDPAATGG